MDNCSDCNNGEPQIFPFPLVLFEEMQDTIKVRSKLMKCKFQPEMAALLNGTHTVEFLSKPGGEL